jgi:cytochrome c oxidase assembly protein subunit 11
MSEQQVQTKNSKMVMKLAAIVIGMFGFGFALVPLYDVLCDALGINGKTSDVAAVYESVDWLLLNLLLVLILVCHGSLAPKLSG